MPFYRYHGILVGFAAHKNHAGVWFPTAPLQNKDRKMLEEKGYRTGKKTIQIKFDQKVPTIALKQILKVVAKTNEGKRAVK